VTAAIFGLIGVIIGGLINGAVTAWQAHRHEKMDGRVAARLVYTELRDIYVESVLPAKLNLKYDSSLRFPTPTWLKQQEVLARVLSDDAWEKVSTAYVWIVASPEANIIGALTPVSEEFDEAAHKAALLEEAMDRLQEAGRRSPRVLRR
jgi:hypothetical protein